MNAPDGRLPALLTTIRKDDYPELAHFPDYITFPGAVLMERNVNHCIRTFIPLAVMLTPWYYHRCRRHLVGDALKSYTYLDAGCTTATWASYVSIGWGVGQALYDTRGWTFAQVAQYAHNLVRDPETDRWARNSGRMGALIGFFFLGWRDNFFIHRFVAGAGVGSFMGSAISWSEVDRLL